MPKSKRVLIIGLPLFARRIKASLSKIDSINNYTALDTYYNFFHKIIGLYHLVRADIVYSINGTLGNSRMLNLAFKLNKKVVMQWVGTDVTTAIKQFQVGQYDERYLKAKHLTVAPWLKNELEEINIYADLQYISAYKTEKTILSFPEMFSILSYIPVNRADYYGKNEVFALARNFPELNFYIVGSEKKDYKDPPENIVFKGWVSNINKEIDNAVVCIRFVEHDGMSQFVLESLAKGRYVLYNYDLKGVNWVENLNQMKIEIKELKACFDRKQLPLNQKGIKMINKDYKIEEVFSSLKNNLFS